MCKTWLLWLLITFTAGRLAGEARPTEAGPVVGEREGGKVATFAGPALRLHQRGRRLTVIDSLHSAQAGGGVQHNALLCPETSPDLFLFLTNASTSANAFLVPFDVAACAAYPFYLEVEDTFTNLVTGRNVTARAEYSGNFVAGITKSSGCAMDWTEETKPNSTRWQYLETQLQYMTPKPWQSLPFNSTTELCADDPTCATVVPAVVCAVYADMCPVACGGCPSSTSWALTKTTILNFTITGTPACCDATNCTSPPSKEFESSVVPHATSTIDTTRIQKPVYCPQTVANAFSVGLGDNHCNTNIRTPGGATGCIAFDFKMKLLDSFQGLSFSLSEVRAASYYTGRLVLGIRGPAGCSFNFEETIAQYQQQAYQILASINSKAWVDPPFNSPDQLCVNDQACLGASQQTFCTQTPGLCPVWCNRCKPQQSWSLVSTTIASVVTTSTPVCCDATNCSTVPAHLFLSSIIPSDATTVEGTVAGGDPTGTTSATLGFSLAVIATSQLSSNTTLQQQFTSQLASQVASWFSVSGSQVTVALLPAVSIPLQQVNVSGLQANSTAGANTSAFNKTGFTVAVHLNASWSPDDTTTPTAVRQQVSKLQQDPSALFTPDMVQQWGIDVSPIQLSAISSAPPSFLLAKPSADGVSSPSLAPAPSSPAQGHLGIIIGSVLGGVFAALLVFGSVLWWWRKPRSHTDSKAVSLEPAEGSAVLVVTTDSRSDADYSDRVVPVGLQPEEPFLSHVNNFKWTDCQSQSGMVHIEAGVTDVQLDALAQDGRCPVIELKRTDVSQQLELLTHGLIGKGGAALVFICRWPSRFGPNALLAIKVLRKQYDASPYLLKTFASEAKLLAAMRHPNVLTLYGYCLELPTVCLIMELMPGSLEDMLYKAPRSPGQTISTDASASATSGLPDHADSQDTNSRAAQRPNMLQALQICSDIASALSYLHNRQQDTSLPSLPTEAALPLSPIRTASSTYETPVAIALPCNEELGTQPSTASRVSDPSYPAKVAHRDLKPANVLISSQGRAKLSDFGLAREHDSSTVHTMHVGVGTLTYMAPELLDSLSRPVFLNPTNRVDVYSFGILMWELFSGEKPWQDCTPVQIIGLVGSGQRPLIPPASPLPEDMQDLVDLSTVPASFHVVPELVNLIKDCWQQRDLKRPAAADVHDALLELLQKYTPASEK